MAVCVGIDLVDVASVRASIDAHGDRYLNRIYTDEERDECGMDIKMLATRFAAKEATMKALGRSDEPLAWQSIEVRAQAGPGVALWLHGAARELARARGIARLSLSLGATGASVMALVIGEGAS
ncbi:MAG TPA: holo-ACP synthase [Solirubrobacteraceae bacterium]|nr:holo-ACP synthase [Solirubrobacteraceae bacterium]